MNDNQLAVSRRLQYYHVLVMYGLLGLQFMFQASMVLAQDGELSEEEWVAAMQRWAESRNGRFLLSGVVVDRDGVQLSGVTLSLEKAKLSHGFAEPVYDKETRIINGAFDLDLQGYYSITMTFQADGFLPERFTMAMPDPKGISDKIARGESVPQQVASKNDIRVVLRAVGTQTELIGYNEVLEYEASGRATLVDFSKPHFRGRSLVQTENVHNEAELPENSVYILADRGNDGTIAKVELLAPGKQKQQSFPQHVRVIMRANGDGFVSFEPTVHSNVFGQMKTAPQDGYQKELVLDVTSLRQQIERAPTGDLGWYFYFRTKEQYGKGRITIPEIRNGRVRLRATFRLQADGSTNVETREPSAITRLDVMITPERDTTAPVLTILGNNTVTVQCGAAYADAGATATDAKDGDLTSSVTTASTVNTAAAGTYTVTYRVADDAGNETTATRTVKVLYNFTGFLSPINGADATGGTVADPVKTFKAGSKIPVKFTITCGDNAVNNGAHTLQVVKWNNETTAANPIDASPADAATQGNQFRWSDDHWQYILDTGATGMAVGTWEIRATLSDGSTHSAYIGIK